MSIGIFSYYMDTIWFFTYYSPHGSVFNFLLCLMILLLACWNLTVMDFIKTLGYTIASSATFACDAACHGTVIDSVVSVSVHRIYVVRRTAMTVKLLVP